MLADAPESRLAQSDRLDSAHPRYLPTIGLVRVLTIQLIARRSRKLYVDVVAAGGRRSWHASTAALAAILAAVLLCGVGWQSARGQPTPAMSTDVSTSLNDFGLRLLRSLTDGSSGNVMVSPLSVSLALAMTYNGANGDTRTAIANTLSAESLSAQDFNRNNRVLLDTIRKADPAVEMEIANALWAQSGFPINSEFLKLSRDFFDASALSLNFETDPDKAADAINVWVKVRTHGKISEIIKNPARSTVLILTDAVYFKGRWSFPFDEKQTEPRTFHLQGAGSVTTPMMIQHGKYDYAESDSFQAIRLPYGKGRFAMYVFLPRKNSSLPDFVRSLDEAHWREWTRQARRTKGQDRLAQIRVDLQSAAQRCTQGDGHECRVRAEAQTFRESIRHRRH